MNTKTFAIALGLLATFYLGCTNPNTVIDPRVPAATALSAATPEATGYWMVEAIGTGRQEVGHVALKQLPDGSLIGESFFYSTPATVSGTVSGDRLALSMWVPSGHSSGSPFEGSIEADGTAILSVTDGPRQGHQFKLTKLF